MADSEAVKPLNDEDLIEALANVQHAIWSHWMNYQFRICHRNEDGSVTIPTDMVERWKRQMATGYADLSEREKDSDRNQAHKVMDVLGEPLHAVDFPLEELRVVVDAMTAWSQPPMAEHYATVRVATFLAQMEAQQQFE